jgi:hypothetical protein
MTHTIILVLAAFVTGGLVSGLWLFAWVLDAEERAEAAQDALAYATQVADDAQQLAADMRKQNDSIFRFLSQDAGHESDPADHWKNN